jgi:hypothetical protein
MGEWMYKPTFLDLGTRWRWLVSFTLRPLYTRGNSPRCPLDRRLSRHQSRSGRRGEEKFLILLGLELRPVGRPTRSQSLYRLRYHHFLKVSGQLKNPVISSGMEPATFRLASYCLNQLRYHVPPAFAWRNLGKPWKPQDIQCVSIDSNKKLPEYRIITIWTNSFYLSCKEVIRNESFSTVAEWLQVAIGQRTIGWQEVLSWVKSKNYYSWKQLRRVQQHTPNQQLYVKHTSLHPSFLTRGRIKAWKSNPRPILRWNTFSSSPL